MVGRVLLPPAGTRRPLHVVGESQDQAIARAKGYPYPRPSTSYVFITGANGRCAYHEIDNAAWRGAGFPSAILDLPVGPRISVESNGSSNGTGTSDRGRPAATAGSRSNLAAGSGSNSAIEVSASSGGSESREGAGLTLREALVEAHGIDAATLLPPGTPFTPILAIGSNAGPEQLARKFPPALFPTGAIVPVVQCTLSGFDVVYAPLISSYGSATATLEASPGTEVEVFITFLTPPLQLRMHETEGAYDLLRLDGVALLEGQALVGGAPGSGRRLSSVYQYNHSLGTLHLPLAPPRGGSSPVALSEIPARRRRFPALSQVEMQAALMRGFLAGSSSGGSTSSSGASTSDAEAMEFGGDGSCGAEVAAAVGPLAPVELPPRVDVPPGPADEAPSLSAVSTATAAAPSDTVTAGKAGSSSGSGAGDGCGGGGGGDAEGLDEFIISNLTMPDIRRGRVAALAAHARPFSYARHERLMSLGTIFSKNVE